MKVEVKFLVVHIAPCGLKKQKVSVFSESKGDQLSRSKIATFINLDTKEGQTSRTNKSHVDTLENLVSLKCIMNS